MPQLLWTPLQQVFDNLSVQCGKYDLVQLKCCSVQRPASKWVWVKLNHQELDGWFQSMFPFSGLSSDPPLKKHVCGTNGTTATKHKKLKSNGTGWLGTTKMPGQAILGLPDFWTTTPSQKASLDPASPWRSWKPPQTSERRLASPAWPPARDTNDPAKILCVCVCVCVWGILRPPKQKRRRTKRFKLWDWDSMFGVGDFGGAISVGCFPCAKGDALPFPTRHTWSLHDPFGVMTS